MSRLPGTMAATKRLSVIIPAYNEEATAAQIVAAVQAAPLPGLEKEIIVVDDGSRDRTPEILKGLPGIRLVLHGKNRGKGAAIKTGMAEATGDFIVIQDADLEYDPRDYGALLEPILAGRSELVMGTRFTAYKLRAFLGSEPFFSHYIGNKLIIWLTNWLYGARMTDYECCYKVFTRELSRAFPIEADGFAFDNELICKSLRRGYRLVEVPIRYKPRLYSHGKKIKWWHGAAMLWTIIKWRVLRV